MDVRCPEIWTLTGARVGRRLFSIRPIRSLLVDKSVHVDHTYKIPSDHRPTTYVRARACARVPRKRKPPQVSLSACLCARNIYNIDSWSIPFSTIHPYIQYPNTPSTPSTLKYPQLSHYPTPGPSKTCAHGFQQSSRSLSYPSASPRTTFSTVSSQIPVVLPPLSLKLVSRPTSHLATHHHSPLPLPLPEANITTLSRCDPGHGPSPTQLSASIEWPLAQPASPKAKEDPVARVSIDGRTDPSDLLLKKSIMGKSVSFSSPDRDCPFSSLFHTIQLAQVPASR